MKRFLCHRASLFLVITVLVFAGSSFLSASTGPDLTTAAVQSITSHEIKAHLDFLASDLLQGRGNGDRGLEIAAEYIAAQFRAAGLESAAGDSYFQPFDLIERKLNGVNRLELTTTKGSATVTTDYEFGQDFMSFSFTANKNVVAPIVFAGYGITAPEHKYDDYRSIDVKNKIVLLLRHEPQEQDSSSVFDGVATTEHAQFMVKARNAQEHGALAILVVTDPVNHESYEVFTKEQIWPENQPTRLKTMQLAGAGDNIGIPALHISMQVARDILAGTGKDLSAIQREIDASLKPNSFPVENRTITVQTKVRTETSTVRNVVGLLRGKTDEAIVIGAHYDHDGRVGDEIYNGADDNATGVTALFEVAEAFLSTGGQPERSVVFVAFAAEEKGLYGSKYYVEHPLHPLDQTVAMVQMDMIGRNEDTHSLTDTQRGGQLLVTAEQSKNSLHAIGTTYSSDMKVFSERNNRDIGMEIHYLYDNVQNMVKRSDQWHFIEKGIPAIFYTTGSHPDYHTPSDTADKINIEKMKKVIALIYLTACDLANNPEKPSYMPPGDSG